MSPRITISITCDEGFVADSLRELAAKYEDEMVLDEYYLEHGTAILEPYKEEEDPDDV